MLIAVMLIVAFLVGAAAGAFIGGHAAKGSTLGQVDAWMATTVVRARNVDTYAGVIELPGIEATCRKFKTDFKR